MEAKKHLYDVIRVKPRQGRSAFLRLDMNEYPSGLPEKYFNDIMKRITPETLATYPETEKLENMLATVLQVSPDCILLTSGSEDAIKTIFETFGISGKKSVALSPSYIMYMVFASIYQTVHTPVDYTPDLTIDVGKIIDAIDNDTCIVSLLNPNLPIGDVFTEQDIRTIIQKAKDCGAVVVLDEAYYGFCDQTFVELTQEFDNVIVTRSFSKVYGIPGLRIGYVVTTPEIAVLLRRVKASYDVNTVAIAVAEALLEMPEAIQAIQEGVAEGREYLTAQLKTAGYHFIANSGNFLLIQTRQEPITIKAALEKNKILVNTSKIPQLAPFIRVTIADKAMMETFWTVFQTVDIE